MENTNVSSTEYEESEHEETEHEEPGKSPTHAKHARAIDLKPQKRIEGLDIARGFALLGMITVHLIPWDIEIGVSVFHDLFSGRAAALFALLAGISLALITGGSTPHTGKKLRRDRIAVVTRGLILLIFGLALNSLTPGDISILPYYGVFFLVGSLLIGLHTRTLAVLTGILIVAGPAVVHMALWVEGFDSVRSSTLPEFFTSPLNTVFSLLFIGFYPAATWITFVACGIALGRIDVQDLSVQIKLMFFGGLTAVCSALASEVIVYHFGVLDRIIEATPWEYSDIMFALDYGGETVPGYSWWWLMVDNPHNNTPFSLLDAGGSAVFMVGLSLLASRVLAKELSPIAAAGSMTFTLYTAHLLALKIDHSELQIMWVCINITVAIVFAYFWKKHIGQGPLERLISSASKSTARAVVPRV
ncbi:heparan-alpha-glucosaminide N-acetyltransferase domain-containing protein [Corynebacterium glutamicum]|uniref:Heparan-alpha-glucosaminide N-acetyltransferase catalytic domain-containing protein n=2 Tax=Corynebacterium glutamicum TaxID=1718 RepID=Q5KSB4_CORGT|nr:heparan-alpha-glucosaminide N-acetyltransferase domain-containing protein [Corynebacterium glutamicum]BAD83870.1 hypothetical protein [Corynebacterium glutamicum]BAF52988.1 hypothetical protein cgR_0027 [Corynebacterium glutamicum R]